MWTKEGKEKCSPLGLLTGTLEGCIIRDSVPDGGFVALDTVNHGHDQVYSSMTVP